MDVSFRPLILTLADAEAELQADKATLLQVVSGTKKRVGGQPGTLSTKL